MAVQKELERIPLESTNLDWVSYDENKQELFVQFKSGGLYVYYNVPKQIFDELLTAGSKGRYHAIKIKYSFDYKKLN